MKSVIPAWAAPKTILKLSNSPILKLLPEVYLRIVADIQAAAQAFYRGIAANEGIVEYHFIEIGVRTDDAVAHDRVPDASIGSDGHMRANDGVGDIAARRYAHRWYDDGFFVRMPVGRITAELL